MLAPGAWILAVAAAAAPAPTAFDAQLGRVQREALAHFLGHRPEQPSTEAAIRLPDIPRDAPQEAAARWETLRVLLGGAAAVQAGCAPPCPARGRGSACSTAG